MMETVTFETKCYENDWEFVLKTNYLDEMLRRCSFPFTHKQLIINNVSDISLVSKYAEEKVKAGIIDAYYIAEDYAEDSLRFFEIDRSSFGRVYYYSISELVGLYLSKTTYHLHFSSDAIMGRNSAINWIESAMRLMNMYSDFVVANPLWNYRHQDAFNESIDEIEDFYIGYGFSDQCYLVKNEMFRKPIYNEHNIASSRYPIYGGELFEKRVDSYMRNHELKRITHKEVSYIHQNFPKNELLRLARKLRIYLNF